MPKLKPDTSPAYLPLPTSPLVMSARAKREAEWREFASSILKMLIISALLGWLLAIR